MLNAPREAGLVSARRFACFEEREKKRKEENKKRVLDKRRGNLCHKTKNPTCRDQKAVEGNLTPNEDKRRNLILSPYLEGPDTDWLQWLG